MSCRLGLTLSLLNLVSTERFSHVFIEFFVGRKVDRLLLVEVVDCVEVVIAVFFADHAGVLAHHAKDERAELHGEALVDLGLTVGVVDQPVENNVVMVDAVRTCLDFGELRAVLLELLALFGDHRSPVLEEHSRQASLIRLVLAATLLAAWLVLA